MFFRFAKFKIQLPTASEMMIKIDRLRKKERLVRGRDDSNSIFARVSYTKFYLFTSGLPTGKFTQINTWNGQYFSMLID